MAAVDRIEITIKGKGGHGGIPQRNVDPVVCAAAVIQGVQTIVSRNVSPIECDAGYGDNAGNRENILQRSGGLYRETAGEAGGIHCLGL